jgi:two-component system chemotaxis response regulator CheY
MEEFRNIKAMIVDPTGNSRRLLRGILFSLEVHDIEHTPNASQCLMALRKVQRDVVFYDEMAGVPADFMKTLRRDFDTRNILVPTFLVTAGVDEKQIVSARDAGINGVIVKPVSSATVERKLRATLQTPKDFVATKTFIGPDRRAREDRRLSGDRAGHTERRGQGRSSEAMVIPVIPTISAD